MAEIYRLRSTDRLIGDDNELEEQSIYFASLAELNDPMEGFRNIYMQGDEIVWRNLFRHYVYCLHQIRILYSITAETEPITGENISVNVNFVREENVKLVHLFEEILERIDGNEPLKEFLNEVAQVKRRVSIDEVSIYLRLFHFFALEEIQQTYSDRGLLPKYERYPKAARLVEQFKKSLRLVNILNRESDQKVILEISARTLEGLFMLHKYQWSRSPDNTIGNNGNFLLFDFTRSYLDKVESLIFPCWYVACFMRTHNNSSTWAKYGDGHNGVCLIFETETESDREFLSLREKTVSSSQLYDGETRRLEVQDVNYGSEALEFDFFRSIGRLPEQDLRDIWYMSPNGNMSECGSHLVTEPETWRQEYWKNFSLISTSKSKDWKYEEECRVVLSSIFDDLQDERRRKLKYDFRSLKGIIFGIGTSDSDKFKIFDVIERKCRNHGRSEFDFYQAFYSRKSDDIGRYKLIWKIAL